MAAPLSDIRLAFYGDDFTGSTDALEVLAFAGLRCALFLHVPDAETLRELGPFDAIGMGGQMGQADYFVAALRGRPKPG